MNNEVQKILKALAYTSTLTKKKESPVKLLYNIPLITTIKTKTGKEITTRLHLRLSTLTLQEEVYSGIYSKMRWLMQLYQCMDIDDVALIGKISIDTVLQRTNEQLTYDFAVNKYNSIKNIDFLNLSEEEYFQYLFEYEDLPKYEFLCTYNESATSVLKYYRDYQKKDSKRLVFYDVKMYTLAVLNNITKVQIQEDLEVYEELEHYTDFYLPKFISIFK